MHATKLIQVLKSLNKREIKSFKDYVASPFFNKKQELIELCNYIIKYHPEYEHRNLKKELIYSKICNAKSYSDQQMRLWISNLFILLKGWMAYQFGQRDIYQTDVYALSEMVQYNLEGLSVQLYDKVKRKMEKRKVRDAGYYYTLFELEGVKDQMESAKNRKYNPLLQQKVNHLDCFYLIQKLKYACEMLNRQQIIKADYDFYLVEQIVAFLKQESNPYKDVAAIKVYLAIWDSLWDKDNDEQLYYLIDLLKKEEACFELTELRGLYKYAQNFCIRRINKGKESFYEPLFDIYKQLLENETILQSKAHFANDYLNIAVIGLRLNQYDWVRSFIDTYKQVLPRTQQNNLYYYNLALFYYETKDYDDAIETLHEVHFEDALNNINARCLLVKIYYDAQEWEVLTYYIDAFKAYLLRNQKISKVIRDRVLQFLKTLLKFVWFFQNQHIKKTEPFTKRMEKLKGEMAKPKPMLNPRWVGERFKRLSEGNL